MSGVRAQAAAAAFRAWTNERVAQDADLDDVADAFKVWLLSSGFQQIAETYSLGVEVVLQLATEAIGSGEFPGDLAWATSPESWQFMAERDFGYLLYDWRCQSR